MKKYPKILQTDSRGQIVIPKDIRSELGIGEGTGFFAFTIDQEGIFLKKVEAPELDKETDEIKSKAALLGISKKNIEKAERKYQKTGSGKLEVIR